MAREMTRQRQDEHLQLVSRTFALTIPMLGNPLADWVGLAYLVCRTLDTVEDDADMSSARKVEMLAFLKSFLAEDCEPSAHEEALRDLAKELTGSRIHDCELLAEYADVICRYKTYPDKVRYAIRLFAGRMADLMSEQLQHNIVASQDNLDFYCYAVAGVVGEMLALLFSFGCGKSNGGESLLRDLSVSFGQGLQMTNILKDVWDDADRGVCWLPFGFENGIDPEEMKRCINSVDSETKAKLVRDSVGIASGHLWNAVEFMIRFKGEHSRGVRVFCAVCTSMAFLTLKKIYENPLFKDGAEVKITRKLVNKAVFWAKACAGSDFLLRRYFKWAAGGLPHPAIDATELRRRVSGRFSE